MREGIIREIEAEYAEVRLNNHAEEARRLSEAANVDPMIGALVAERMRLFRSGAREALAHPSEAERISLHLSTRIADIQAELRDRLTLAGFSPDHLQPVYQCNTCHDTGYVGEVVRERCTCFSRRLRQKQANASGHGLSPVETFEAYDESIYRDTPLTADSQDTQRSFMARMRAFCEAYATEFPNTQRHNLLLFGQSGLGKTYLLNCIGNRVHARGEEVVKVTAYQLSERMRAAIFDHDHDGFSLLLEVPLLLVDDLGVEPLYNNITVEHLFTLLNERALHNLHTVISTNLMLDELKSRYTERICSRLFDRKQTALLQFLGTDVRLQA